MDSRGGDAYLSVYLLAYVCGVPIVTFAQNKQNLAVIGSEKHSKQPVGIDGY